MSERVEVIIVGAGPAGLSAALVLGRACRQTIVFDHGQPRNARTKAMHGFITRDGVSPAEFLRTARDELRQYDTIRLEHAEVTEAKCIDGGRFRVELADGRVFESLKLLIATGVRDELPNVPGLEPLFGRGVYHCPFCDGWEFRNGALAVYGRGQRGHGLALELLGWSTDIVLLTDGSDDELTRAQRDRLSRNGIALREDRVARLEGNGAGLERVVFADGSTLARDVLFFTTGQRQASKFASALGCAFNEKGTVHTGRHESTDVPGLFVAGDASRDVQWVVIAAAEGAEAAFAMTQDLIKASIK